MRVLAPLLFVLASAPATAAELDWLAGHWCNAETEELWLPEREGLLLGVNRARAGKPAFEFLRIEIVDGKARYLAQPGGRPPTEFSEFVTHSGVAANLESAGGNVRYASNNGFASSNPLSAAGTTGPEFIGNASAATCSGQKR